MSLDAPVTNEQVDAMNKALLNAPTSRFCPLQALQSGVRLTIVSHKFEGKTQAQPVVVRVAADGKTILTKLEGLKSAPEIKCRTPVLYVNRSFAGRNFANSQDLLRASQYYEVSATDVCEGSAEAVELLDLREQWGKYVYKHGCAKSDPRAKQVAKMQKTLSEADFVERFKEEMLAGPGSPYMTYCAKRDEENPAFGFRKKPWERLWSEKDSTEFKHDEYIDGITDLRNAVDYPCRIVPIDIMLGGKSIVDEEYEAIADSVHVGYINFTLKLVRSDANKTETMMATPTQLVVGALGPARSSRGSSAEQPVDIFNAVVSSKRKASGPPDIMEVLSAAATAKKAK